jgi:hypothetical protein
MDWTEEQCKGEWKKGSTKFTDWNKNSKEELVRIGLGYKLITYLLTPWSRVLLEKLTVFQLVKKFSSFMELEGLLPHSQVPANCHYPEPARSSPHPHIPLPEDPS